MTRPITTRPSGASESAGSRLDLLFREHRLTLMRYFTRNRASVAEAEDLTQEAFLRLTDADQSCGKIARPAAYLKQIGRNLMRDRAGSPARRNEVAVPELIDNAMSDANEVGRLEARDRLRRIEAALQKLKPRTREIFLAHRLDGMTYGEIAEWTGLSVKGVEKQMSKAIAEIGRITARLG
ncbi:RNA polymerase sigma factor [Sphingomonas sp. PB4P5]|uniref:RNA polymerase sigma factor n=1 Tax=Parasphingomonas puruogangriensis TaxID=3096155 RepID=UPI002FCC1650